MSDLWASEPCRCGTGLNCISKDCRNRGESALIPVKVRVVIEYTTNLQRDPLAYDGANTEEAIVAREASYIEEGGDYLFSILSEVDHKCVAKVTITRKKD